MFRDWEQRRAILVTGYNRPKFLRSVLNNLSQLGCSNIWISLDGPKSNDDKDLQKTIECKELLKNYSFFDASKIKINETNLGCKYGMSAALNWFFSNNDSGIIIEDDIVFGRDFLLFCELALEKFKDDTTIGSISGFQPLEVTSKFKAVQYSHIVHPFFSVWGWASWADRWSAYDVELKNWGRRLNLLELSRRTHGQHIRYWIRRFNEFEDGQVDSWDFQFLFSHLENDWKVITPFNNLVGNVGFGENATHTKKVRTVPRISKLNPNFDFGVPLEANRAIIKQYLEKQFGLK
jgi:hypothetical protein